GGGDGDPLERGLGGAKAFPIDVALGTVDCLEWSASSHSSLTVWHHALNNDFPIAATAGEDSNTPPPPPPLPRTLPPSPFPSPAPAQREGTPQHPAPPATPCSVASAPMRSWDPGWTHAPGLTPSVRAIVSKAMVRWWSFASITRFPAKRSTCPMAAAR